MSIRKLAATALLGVAAIGLSACSTGLPTQVSRYQAMPIPQGQSFYIVPASGGQPSLEFGRYASLVARHLEAKGYRSAGAPQLADMLVKLDYGVDEGVVERSADPMGYSMYGDPRYGGLGYSGLGGYGGGFRRVYDPRTGRVYRVRDPFYDPFYDSYYGRPYYSRYGYYGGGGSPFYYGWNDPFGYGSRYSRYGSRYGGYGSGYGQPVREYTVYKSYLDMDIVRRADNAPLFDGKAQARSQTDETGVLVPNLIEAMFTGFPGKSGETVKITVPARRN